MRYAIAKNNKEDYGLVVLSLLASEQEALRKMEFSTLNHEAFQTHMFNMESEFVPEALNMKVHYKTTHTAGDGGQGNFRKTFRTVRELWIWGDDTYPDMDIIKDTCWLTCTSSGGKAATYFPLTRSSEILQPTAYTRHLSRRSNCTGG